MYEYTTYMTFDNVNVGDTFVCPCCKITGTKTSETSYVLKLSETKRIDEEITEEEANTWLVIY